MPIPYNYRKICRQKKKRIEKIQRKIDNSERDHCERDTSRNAFWEKYTARQRESTYYKDDEERRRCCYSPDDVYHN